MRRTAPLLLCVLACASNDPNPPNGDGEDGGMRDTGATADAGPRDAGVPDGASRDAGDRDAGAQNDRDAGARDAGARDGGAPDAGPEPTERLDPVPGELTIVQLDLPAGVTVRLGEAAVLVGPAGSIALLDVGNSNHDDDVRAVVRDLNTRLLTPARGFAARDALQIEWMILTHVHGDHVGAFADLMSGADALEVRNGIVHRGFVDVGDAMNTNDYDDLCDRLTTDLAPLDRPLCVAATPAPCPYDAASGPHPAVGCPGLFAGDLATTDDDGDGLPAFIDLDGARITFAVVDGHTSDGATIQAVPAFGHDDSNEENARSLGGLVAYGAFRYWFGGDLTGSGDAGEPDVESAVASRALPAFAGALGVDIVHAHHHARRTSSNAAFIDASAPNDGLSRNVVAGINAAHLGSPHDDVVEHWTDASRLGQGRFWVTTSAAGGATEASHPALVVADGDVLVQTLGQGLGYRVQADGANRRSARFDAVR
ncbi:MAG: MBL fold metallo-hydrolase [Deltaproteobacteria bacterium]